MIPDQWHSCVFRFGEVAQWPLASVESAGIYRARAGYCTRFRSPRFFISPQDITVRKKMNLIELQYLLQFKNNDFVIQYRRLGILVLNVYNPRLEKT